ncbi:MAG: ABC transporter ATP-binding protein [Desulfurivibrionaceae bacterium]
MPNSPAIIFEQVKKSYRHDFKRTTAIALAGLDLEVKNGEVFGVVGPNGAGKSTSLKILMGFVRADSGRINLMGHNPGSPEAHNRVGYLPENPCLYENLNITDHLRFAARTSGNTAQIKDRIKDILAMVDLAHAARTPIRRFSKGMTQRAALAYALFHEPEILILDEPMSGLDPLGRRLVVDIIRQYNQKGHTILFCSHILTDVERICDRIGIMDRGKLVSTITPAELESIPEQSGIESPLESCFLKTIKGEVQEKEKNKT